MFHNKKGKRISKDERTKDVHRKTTKRGYANDQSSYKKISGLWESKTCNFPNNTVPFSAQFLCLSFIFMTVLNAEDNVVKRVPQTLLQEVKTV